MKTMKTLGALGAFSLMVTAWGSPMRVRYRSSVSHGTAKEWGE